jgi:hypothetical protein
MLLCLASDLIVTTLTLPQNGEDLRFVSFAVRTLPHARVQVLLDV